MCITETHTNPYLRFISVFHIRAVSVGVLRIQYLCDCRWCFVACLRRALVSGVWLSLYLSPFLLRPPSLPPLIFFAPSLPIRATAPCWIQRAEDQSVSLAWGVTQRCGATQQPTNQSSGEYWNKSPPRVKRQGISLLDKNMLTKGREPLESTARLRSQSHG